jgi:hypothetical protein
MVDWSKDDMEALVSLVEETAKLASHATIALARAGMLTAEGSAGAEQALRGIGSAYAKLGEDIAQTDFDRLADVVQRYRASAGAQ